MPIRRPGVGEHITFGAYEQDGNYANGKEPIEWVVLDVMEDEMIMIALYGLDVIAYHRVETHATWDSCDLRQWLNNTFVNQAFTQSELGALRNQAVTAERNHWHNSYDPGQTVYDPVFLLSVHEFETYILGFDPVALGLSKNQTRNRMDALPYGSLNRCQPTAYADQQGTKVKSDFCRWWLRSPGDGRNNAANVFSSGHYIDDNFKVTATNVCVRPAIRVNIEAAMG